MFRRNPSKKQQIATLTEQRDEAVRLAREAERALEDHTYKPKVGFTIVEDDEGNFTWITWRKVWERSYVGGKGYWSQNYDREGSSKSMPSGKAKTLRSAEIKARRALVPFQVGDPSVSKTVC